MSAETVSNMPAATGFTAAEPVAEADWEDVVRWEVNTYWQLASEHNRDGFMCEIAGSPECLALGHKADPDEGWDTGDDHPYGWDHCDPICPATRYATACTTCESDECEWDPTDTASFWGLFRSRRRSYDPVGG